MDSVSRTYEFRPVEVCDEISFKNQLDFVNQTALLKIAQFLADNEVLHTVVNAGGYVEDIIVYNGYYEQIEGGANIILFGCASFNECPLMFTVDYSGKIWGSYLGFTNVE